MEEGREGRMGFGRKSGENRGREKGREKGGGKEE